MQSSCNRVVKCRMRWSFAVAYCIVIMLYCRTGIGID
jgi:hypothetical protein